MNRFDLIRDEKIKEAKEVYDKLNLPSNPENMFLTKSKQKNENSSKQNKLMWTRLSDNTNSSLIIE